MCWECFVGFERLFCFVQFLDDGCDGRGRETKLLLIISVQIFCTADVCIFTMVGKAGKASFLVGNFCLGSRSKVVCQARQSLITILMSVSQRPFLTRNIHDCFSSCDLNFDSISQHLGSNPVTQIKEICLWQQSPQLCVKTHRNLTPIPRSIRHPLLKTISRNCRNFLQQRVRRNSQMIDFHATCIVAPIIGHIWQIPIFCTMKLQLSILPNWHFFVN